MTEIGIADLVKIMMEDCKVQEAQWDAEQRREREVADLERVQVLERALMCKQMGILIKEAISLIKDQNLRQEEFGREVSLPPGRKVSMLPEREESLLPGREESLPPGREVHVALPPGREVSLPPGREPNLPPGMEVSLLPGREESLPPGREPNLPPGMEVSLLPGREESLPPGREPNLPPGREVSLLPGREESLLPGREESLPSRRDEPAACSLFYLGEECIFRRGKRSGVSAAPERKVSTIGERRSATAGEKRDAAAASRYTQYTEVGVPVVTPTVCRGPHGLNAQQTRLLPEKEGGVWWTGHPLCREHARWEVWAPAREP